MTADKEHCLPDHGGKYLTFRLGGETHGLPILKVQEIIGMQTVTRIPRTPSFVRGVINLRGKVIPVVDLRHRLGLAHDVLYGDKARIIIVDLGAQYTGMLVDAVTGIWRLPPDSSKPPPKKGTQVDGIYLSGVAHYDGRNILLLDLGRVLTVNEVNQVNAWQAKDNPEPES